MDSNKILDFVQAMEEKMKVPEVVIARYVSLKEQQTHLAMMIEDLQSKLDEVEEELAYLLKENLY